MPPHPTRAWSLSLAAAAAAFAVASQAQAHAHLLRSTPASNSTVSRLKHVELRFSEKLEPRFSGFDLRAADGRKVALAAAVNKADRTRIEGDLAASLAPGAYKVSWRAVSADGHRMQGTIAFKVQ